MASGSEKSVRPDAMLNVSMAWRRALWMKCRRSNRSMVRAPRDGIHVRPAYGPTPDDISPGPNVPQVGDKTPTLRVSWWTKADLRGFSATVSLIPYGVVCEKHAKVITGFVTTFLSGPGPRSSGDRASVS